MKSVFFLLFLLLASFVLAKPKPSDDVEAVADDQDKAEGEKETMMEKTDEEASASSGDGSGDFSTLEDNSDMPPDVLTFNLALFPGSSIFGTNMFQKLQESLRVIRDQLNSMWSMNGDSQSILDMPDDYKNSTSQSKMINGTLVTINETISKVTDADGVQSITHVKVISVHPETDPNAAPAQMVSQQHSDSEVVHSGDANLDTADTGAQIVLNSAPSTK